MKKIKFVFVLVSIVFLSCNEDALELTDQNTLNSDSFMRTESQAIEAVTAIYDPLNHIGMYRFAFVILGEIATDNIINENGDGAYGPDMIKLNAYNWDSNNRYFAERWNGAYKGISRANFLLDNLDKVTDFSDGKRNELEGQALFLRALFYYNLIGFGDIPLVTTILSPAESNSITKSPAADVLAQMASDLSKAAQLLPSSYPNEEVGRATKGAAYGLLSRVLLWTKDYEGASNAAEQVDLLGYSLLASDDYVKMFDGRMENSSESVFETQVVPDTGDLWSDERSETTLLMHIFPRVSWGVYMIPRKTASYDIVTAAFEDDDIRRKASMLISGQDVIDYPSLGPDVTGLFGDITVGDGEEFKDYRLDLQVPGAYQMRKFLSYKPENWKRGGSFFNEGTAINIPVIRYSEVLLNKAEAYAEQNRLGEAADALEEIRLRAGLTMDNVNVTDQAALLDQIKKDRRVELMFEGHRWYDLKRWGELDSALNAAGLNYSGQDTWFIPQAEKDVNPNL